MERPVSVRVLVADDDPDIRGLVAMAVTRAGLELVGQLGDGDAAWESIRTSAPDLVVLDVSMPGKTGVDLARLIRADPLLASTRVILLSAAVDDNARQRGMDAGADGYFIKPFSPRDLALRLADVARELQGQS